VEAAFKAAYPGSHMVWDGEGSCEVGTLHRTDTGPVRAVEVDSDFYRPLEVDVLKADNSKARDKLGWTPETPFDELVANMVRRDHVLADQGRFT